VQNHGLHSVATRGVFPSAAANACSPMEVPERNAGD